MEPNYHFLVAVSYNLYNLEFINLLIPQHKLGFSMPVKHTTFKIIIYFSDKHMVDSKAI